MAQKLRKRLRVHPPFRRPAANGDAQLRNGDRAIPRPANTCYRALGLKSGDLAEKQVESCTDGHFVFSGFVDCYEEESARWFTRQYTAATAILWSFAATIDGSNSPWSQRTDEIKSPARGGSPQAPLPISPTRFVKTPYHHP
jgi:hypothetical protein